MNVSQTVCPKEHSPSLGHWTVSYVFLTVETPEFLQKKVLRALILKVEASQS